MGTYFLNLAGQSRDRLMIEARDLDEARNEGVRYLGNYLSEHPTFASEGHWRLDIENEAGSIQATVIVATVTPR